MQLRNTLQLPADDTGTYMAHAYISMPCTNATRNDRSITHQDETERSNLEAAGTTQDDDDGEQDGQDKDHEDTTDDDDDDDDDDHDNDDDDDDDDDDDHDDHDDRDDHDDVGNDRHDDDHNRGGPLGRRVQQPAVIGSRNEGSTTSNAVLPSQGGRRAEPTRKGGAREAQDTEENRGMNASGGVVDF